MPNVKAAVYAHRDVKDALRQIQHNKCAYCETLNPTSHDAVEHFRPKNGWQQKSGDRLHQPGYFWLGYEWENLLFACDRCNDAAHKGNLFPLSNPSRRAEAANPDIASEKPLLIDPYTIDPSRHIEWNRDIPRPRNKSRYGRTSIQVFGLDQDGLLMDQRRKYLNEVENVLIMVELSPQENPSRPVMVRLLAGRLEDTEPWAAMVRANFADRIRRLVRAIET